MIRLYDFELSGNAHKIRNQLALLGIEYERVTVDLVNGEQHGEAFRALNPLGQVPVLVDEDVVVRDSNAILVYLGRLFGRGEWLPVDAEGEARVQEWLAFSADKVTNGPAFARLITLFGADGDLDKAQKRAKDVLEQVDAHLDGRAFLAGERATIADIANYSYIALAPDGGVELDDYPNVRAWIRRLEALRGFQPASVQ